MFGCGAPKSGDCLGQGRRVLHHLVRSRGLLLLAFHVEEGGVLPEGLLEAVLFAIEVVLDSPFSVSLAVAEGHQDKQHRQDEEERAVDVLQHLVLRV